ncbi:MAG: DUF6356 family protein [Gammaproteobacteria bacterium]|nr:DUF6356 family protein [Gammaproteobacteria bacterium]
MSQILRDFYLHPQSVGESYLEHWLMASRFAALLAVAAAACLIHAFVPGLCKHTASRCISRLHEQMVTNRRRQG